MSTIQERRAAKILEQLGGPVQTTVDGLTVKSPTVSEMLEALRYLEQDNTQTSTRPFRIQFIQPPGAVGDRA